MKKSPYILFETETSLQSIAAGLRTARLLRGDSQQIAAERIGTSLSTYQRMESGIPESMASIACGILFNALSVYGHAAGVLSLGNPEDDVDRGLLTRPKRQRGRTHRLERVDLGGPVS